MIAKNAAEINQSSENYIGSAIEFYYTNSTFAFYSMLNGTEQSKKFGGETGNDPDYFYVKVSLLLNESVVKTDTIYLADYRFENNEFDYIVNDWRYVTSDFGLNYHNRIKFEFFSSDTTETGEVKTPMYFCMDVLILYYYINSNNEIQYSESRVNPNPAKEQLFIKSSGKPAKSATVFNLQGQQVTAGLLGQEHSLSVAHLSPGYYFLKIGESKPIRFVKE